MPTGHLLLPLPVVTVPSWPSQQLQLQLQLLLVLPLLLQQLQLQQLQLLVLPLLQQPRHQLLLHRAQQRLLQLLPPKSLTPLTRSLTLTSRS